MKRGVAVKRAAPAATALLAGLLAAAIVPGSEARAGGCRDLEDGWLLPPGRMALLLSGSAALPDSGMEDVRAWAVPTGAWVSAGIAQLYGMPELPLRALVAGWAAWRCAWAASWQRLGADALREDRLRLRVMRGDRRRFGLALGLDRLRLAGRELEREASLGAEVVWPCPAGIAVRLNWPLAATAGWVRQSEWRRWLGVSGGGRRSLWAVAIDRARSGEPAVQLEAAIRLAPGCAAGLRSEPSTGSVGLNTAWSWRGALLRTSHLVHPDLGLTHRWSLTLGRPGPDPPP